MSEMALFWEMFLEETTLLSKNRRLVWNLWEFPALLFFGGYSWSWCFNPKILLTEATHFTLGTNPRTASSGKHRHGWWQPDAGSYGVWDVWAFWICIPDFEVNGFVMFFPQRTLWEERDVSTCRGSFIVWNERNSKKKSRLPFYDGFTIFSYVFSMGFSLLHDTMADIGRPKTGAEDVRFPGQVILHSGALPSLLKLLSHAKKARDPMGKPMPIGSMVLLYMVTWIPSIYPQC